ncbi:anti-sigma factor [Goekera deserti]|uniref:anti-sigma factor n=1 Tax=Goekera deserti TaxID=2497753 RepID=UPI001F36ECE7|nr:anti-sigma factor [Goekera deserti]
MAALSEPLTPDQDAHLASCGACSAEVGSLRRGVDTLTALPRPATAPAVLPPPAVWSAIAAATGVSATPRPEVLAASAAAGGAPGAPPPPAPTAAAPRPPADPPVDELALRRRARRRWLAAVAASLAVGIVVGASGAALVGRSDDAVTVAAAGLSPYGGSDASGEAVLRVRDDESRVLDVRLTVRPTGGDYFEVWLLDPASQRMIALGVLDGGQTALPVPDGVDTSVFRTVDVSREAVDGDPAHSAFSIARGEL